MEKWSQGGVAEMHEFVGDKDLGVCSDQNIRNI